MYKSRSPLYDEEDTIARRMEAVSALGRVLQHTTTIMDAEAPKQRQLYKQVKAALPAASILTGLAVHNFSSIRQRRSIAGPEGLNILVDAHACPVHAWLRSGMWALAMF